MGDYKKKVQSDNKHLSNLTSARFAHVEASQTDYVVRSIPGRLLRVVLNTNGGVVVLKNGSAIIASIAADAPEGPYDYGIYCHENINITTGAGCDVTVVFDD
jgi:hypothetical protein